MTPDRASALRAFGAVDAFNRHRPRPSVARMLARVTTFTIDGLDPRRVTVEIDVRAGLPNFAIVGLADRAVREARERVRAAILNSGFEFPLKRVTVNLAPASMRKAGPGFDLAIACAILAVGGHIPADALERYAVFGELGLGGEMRPCRGALAVAEGAARAGLAGLVVPLQRALEAGARRRARRGRGQQPGAGGRDPARRRAPAAARRRGDRRSRCPSATSTSPTSAATRTSSRR